MLKFFKKYTLPSLLSKEVEDDWTVLDLGCGRNSSLRCLDNYKVGFDMYLPYIEKSKTKKIHDEYVIGDLRDVLPFDDNSFDCVVATEVIEHLEKEEGIRMLKEMERVARKKIILTTPNGFLPVDTGPEDNPEEEHISGWKVIDFKGQGFEVFGLNELKFFGELRRE